VIARVRFKLAVGRSQGFMNAYGGAGLSVTSRAAKKKPPVGKNRRGAKEFTQASKRLRRRFFPPERHFGADQQDQREDH